MSNMLRFAHVYLVVLSLVVLCGAAFGADYYVSGTTGSDTTGDGSQSTPWATIQHAIDSVTGIESNLANIHVASGVYYKENLIMKSYVSLSGGYDPATWTRDIGANETVIDGEHKEACLIFEDVIFATVEGFTLTNGGIPGRSGGGVLCVNSSPTMQDNIITNNYAGGGGGGIACHNNTSATIQNNIITNNSGDSAGGGGILCDGSSPTIQDNIISNNVAGYGGGILCNFGSSPTIANNTISNNSDGSGGGIFCWNSSSPTIQNNVISGNSSQVNGGGIFCQESSPTILDNVIVANNANVIGHGAAIHCLASSPTIRGNIIAANSGSGIRCYERSVPSILNNIIAGNSAIDRTTFMGIAGGILCSDSSPMIQDNVISGNYAGTFGGGVLCTDGSSPTIQNNTISNNATLYDNGGGILCAGTSPLVMNNIFYENTNFDVCERDPLSDPSAYYNDFYGSTPGIWRDEGMTTLTTIAEVNALPEAENNLSVPPRFIPAISGMAASVTYNATTFQSTITDDSASFSSGALVRLLVNAANTIYIQFPVAANTATEITLWGDITPLLSSGEGYRVFDYHLSPGSALINAGTYPGFDGDDIDGDARPQGAGYDIGADEFVGIPVPIVGEGEGEELFPEEAELELELDGEPERIGDREPEPGEGEAEEPAPVEEEEVEADEEPSLPVEDAGDNEDASPTPTPSVLTLCPVARTTASTALAAKIEPIREWRDERLLATRLGEAIVKLYYGRE